jgi:hypothetical protein
VDEVMEIVVERLRDVALVSQLVSLYLRHSQIEIFPLQEREYLDD